MFQLEISISVIVCAYTHERWDMLVEAVNSVRQQSYRAHEIFVVIDHNPVLFERAHRYFTGVTVVKNTARRGLSDARNTGMACASGEIVAFLDDDAVAHSDWLQHLRNAFIDSFVIGVGGAVIPRWQGPVPRWFPAEFLWVVGCTYKGMSHSIRNPIGANMAFRRQACIDVGGFRGGLGRVGSNTAGCEETELSIRIAKRWPSKHILYSPSALVSHYVPAKRATFRYFLFRCLAEGRSKALVSRYVGATSGLSAERLYVLHVLPQGVKSGLEDTMLRHESYGYVRATVILLGLTATITGYAIEFVRWLFLRNNLYGTGKEVTVDGNKAPAPVV